MVTLITLHMLSPDDYDQSMGVLTKNTELACKAPGFITRKVLIDVNDKLKGYSMTSWETQKNMDDFLASPERPPLEFEGEEKRVYEITPSGRIMVFSLTNSDSFTIDVENNNPSLSDSKIWTGRYTQISLHLLDKNNREQGLDILRRNTPIAAKQPGFVSRQVYVCPKDPLKSYSIATWESKKALDDFKTANGRPVIIHAKDGITYEKTDSGLIPVFPIVDSGVFQTVNEA